MKRRYDPECKLEAMPPTEEEDRKMRDAERSTGVAGGILKGRPSKYAIRDKNAFVKEAGHVGRSGVRG